MTSTPPFSYWLNEPNTVRYSLTTTSWSPFAVRIVTILYRQARRLSRIVRGGTEILLGHKWGTWGQPPRPPFLPFCRFLPRPMLAVCRGRNTHMPLEPVREMTLGGKPRRKRDV